MRSIALALLLFSPLTAGSPGPSPVPVVSRVPTKEQVVFITIDDGFTRSASAHDLLEDLGWPVTSFVLPSPLARDVGYFRSQGSLAEFGNHSTNHPNLKRLSFAAQKREICTARTRITKLVGAHTALFRPPYGSYSDTTRRAAAACGMTHLVTWRVTVWGSKISTWGGDIRAGDVILLHYVPSLDQSLRTLAAELKRLGLRPALLSDYLR